MSTREDPIKSQDFLESLSSFSKLHRSQKWEGTFGEFLTNIVAAQSGRCARSSHQYIWDMLRWHGQGQEPTAGDSLKARALFRRELFGIDEPLSRVVDYFKAAAAGSDVGPAAAAAARAALGRQIDPGNPDEARPGGIQPHRCGRAVRHQGLAAAREPR